MRYKYNCTINNYQRPGRIGESLSINRMIAVIFLEISKKQISPENTITELMKCIDTLDHLAENVFAGVTKKEVAKKLHHIMSTQTGLVSPLH